MQNWRKHIRGENEAMTNLRERVAESVQENAHSNTKAHTWCRAEMTETNQQSRRAEGKAA